MLFLRLSLAKEALGEARTPALGASDGHGSWAPPPPSPVPLVSAQGARTARGRVHVQVRGGSDGTVHESLSAPQLFTSRGCYSKIPHTQRLRRAQICFLTVL